LFDGLVPPPPPPQPPFKPPPVPPTLTPPPAPRTREEVWADAKALNRAFCRASLALIALFPAMFFGAVVGGALFGPNLDWRSLAPAVLIGCPVPAWVAVRLGAPLGYPPITAAICGLVPGVNLYILNELWTTARTEL